MPCISSAAPARIAKAFMLSARKRGMGFWKWADGKAKGMGALDIGLVKVSVFFFTLMLAKLWAPLLALDWQWYALLCVLAAIKPACAVFCKK